MTKFTERYLSFTGRLSRLPFFLRGITLGITAAVMFAASVPLFINGARALWWAGLAVAIGSLIFLAVGSVSLLVRRLHDLGLSGYHTVWVGTAQVGWTALSHGPKYAILFGLPFAGICLWLIFWPGNAGVNRFGERRG